jgi:hypothetical protein
MQIGTKKDCILRMICSFIYLSLCWFWQGFNPSVLYIRCEMNRYRRGASARSVLTWPTPIKGKICATSRPVKLPPRARPAAGWPVTTQLLSLMRTAIRVPARAFWNFWVQLTYITREIIDLHDVVYHLEKVYKSVRRNDSSSWIPWKRATAIHRNDYHVVDLEQTN